MKKVIEKEKRTKRMEEKPSVTRLIERKKDSER